MSSYFSFSLILFFLSLVLFTPQNGRHATRTVHNKSRFSYSHNFFHHGEGHHCSFHRCLLRCCYRSSSCSSRDCGVSNFKIKDTTNNNDERALRKHDKNKKKEDEVFEETVSAEAPGAGDNAAAIVVDSTEDTTSPAPTPLAKSGKTPDHGHGDGEECDLEVLQRAQMFVNYMFRVLDLNHDNEVTKEEFGNWSTANGEIADNELAAVKAIGGTSIAFSLKELATAVEEHGSEPITLVEFEAAVILHYCNNDQSAFTHLVDRNGLFGDGCYNSQYF